ncbi:MAG: T9SS type A sorting domain-containing protein, partial [Gemmatimonadetes bacterium]|nr:T9SS type A sorting domain-containing protein [Gemmatimonadota bacterium]
WTTLSLRAFRHGEFPPEREHWDHYEAFALDPIRNKIYGAIQTSTFSSSEGAYRTGTEFSRSNLDDSNIEEKWRPSFNWWKEIPPTTTDIALDLSHPTSVSTPSTTPAIPTTSGLSPNFPNPFNASTQIAYDIASPGPVRLTIYNILGQPIRTLVNQFQPAGSYQVRWDARDQQGTALAAGVYLMRLYYPGGDQTRQLLLLK